MELKRLVEKTRMRLFPHKGLKFKVELHARLFKSDIGQWEDLGKIADKCVTTAGCTFLVTCFAGSALCSDIKYHGSGTGTGVESVNDTSLTEITECSPQRGLGVATTSSGVIYRSVGTQTYTTAHAVTEHGIFSANTGPTLWDRSVFSAINVVNGDSIEWTYLLTIVAGG